MKLLDAEPYVLWAWLPGEKVPFEVSREVSALHPRCPHSPYCPGERLFRIVGMPSGPGGRKLSTPTPDFDPEFVFDPSVCPYRYASKEECFRSINHAALKAGCIPQRELARTAGFLKSLGYRVKAERVDAHEFEGTRILLAHRPIYNFHELRVEHCIGGQILYLIRNPSLDESPPDAEEV
jgi:hypothetical protein